MQRGQHININRNLEEVGSNLNEWLWGVQDFIEEITEEVLEIATDLELEVELEDVTELLQFHDKLEWMRSCFLWKSKESGFLSCNLSLVKILWRLLK